MMEPHPHQPSSSQAGDSHIFLEPTFEIPLNPSILGEVERINRESSKITLLDADKAATLIKQVP